MVGIDNPHPEGCFRNHCIVVTGSGTSLRCKVRENDIRLAQVTEASLHCC